VTFYSSLIPVPSRPSDIIIRDIPSSLYSHIWIRTLFHSRRDHLTHILYIPKFIFISIRSYIHNTLFFMRGHLFGARKLMGWGGLLFFSFFFSNLTILLIAPSIPLLLNPSSRVPGTGNGHLCWLSKSPACITGRRQHARTTGIFFFSSCSLFFYPEGERPPVGDNGLL